MIEQNNTRKLFDFEHANSEQQKAIKQTEGPVLIIAGPGTGKTFTLVKRAVYLIVEKHVAPENIMIATFTEKAAKELITRITNELIKIGFEVNVNDLYIGTIHSICLRFIKENLEYTRLKKNYRLLDDFDQKYLVYFNHKQFDAIENIDVLCDSKSAWERAKRLTQLFNAISEELVTVEDLRADGDINIQVLSMAYETYLDMLEKENALDFSSIQLIAYNLIKDSETVRDKLQAQLQYVMIDEYQDTNYVQEQIIFLLGDKHKNICVVGDDDQGLYRFRGATIRNILEFPNKFDNCTQFKLEENYRSEKDIIKFYNEWMTDTEIGGFDWGKYRYSKLIKPAKKDLVEGTPTVLKVAGTHDLNNWCENILYFITKLKENNTIKDYNQIALLFRSVKNDRARKLADYLEKHGIPVYSPRSDMFFERSEIQLMIGTLVMCFPRYVKSISTDKFYPKIMEKYYGRCVSIFLEYKKINPDCELVKWCAKTGTAHDNPNGTFDYAFTGLVYQMMQFEPFCSIMGTQVSGVVDTRPLRNLAQFTQLTTKYEYLHRISVLTAKGMEIDTKQFFNRYMRFLYEGGLAEYEDDSEYAPSGCVSFMTIHQSKGMEFPVVIIGSLYAIPRLDGSAIIMELENNVYHREAFEPYDQIKYYDFWRVYYTAFSRAQDMLVLTADEGGRGNGKEPSKYFNSLYDKLPNFWDTDIDYGKFKCHPVKDVNIKESYSFTSHIALYENCSWQYKYFKDLEFVPVREGATLFGTLVHATIEDIHKTAMRGEYDSITEENIENWFADNYATISNRERAYLQERTRKAALEQVLKYVDKQNGDWSKIIEAEVDVSHVENDYILTGKIDLIKGEGDTLEIVDFKAERKPDMEKDNERIRRYRRQLQVYAYIIEKRTGKQVSKMHLYYTGEKEGVPTISFRNEPEKLNYTINEFSGVVHKIQGRDYSTRSTSQKLCDDCDLRHFCRKI